jgi:hypothetical protein
MRNSWKGPDTMSEVEELEISQVLTNDQILNIINHVLDHL